MSENIPSQFWQGVEEFNQGEFYACHDTLEAIWMEASQPEKRFYQGILQIAVGCYHLTNHNERGAAILLGEGINKLQTYAPVYHSIDVSNLLEQSIELLTVLQQTKKENIADFVKQLQLSESDHPHFPKIFLSQE